MKKALFCLILVGCGMALLGCRSQPIGQTPWAVTGSQDLPSPPAATLSAPVPRLRAVELVPQPLLGIRALRPDPAPEPVMSEERAVHEDIRAYFRQPVSRAVAKPSCPGGT